MIADNRFLMIIYLIIMKKTLALIMCLLSSMTFLMSSDMQNSRMIESASPLYEYVDALYSLCGFGKPTTNRPWSEAEARQIISLVDSRRLDETGLKLLAEAQKLINDKRRFIINDEFSMSAGADFTYELYAHRNEDFCLESDWARGYSKRKPLIHFSFDFAASDFFYTYFDVNYQFGRASHLDEYNYYSSSDKISLDGYVGSYKLAPTAHYVSKSHFFSSALISNFYTDTYDFSFIWPKRAIFSFGGKNWNISLNRDRLKIGDSHIGNLLVDDYTDYNDFCRLSVFVNGFRYDWIAMFFNTLTSSSETMTEESRMFLIHTLEFRIWDRLSLKVSENVMYKYEVMDFQFLNPAFIYHNLNNRSMFNAIAYIEATMQLCRGLNLYGQYIMDQARAPHEGPEQSDASGFIAGIEHTAALSKGLLGSYAEFVCTMPLLYRRDKVDFIKVSRYYHQNKLGIPGVESGHIPFFEFIGLQFGGDTIALKVGADYTIPGLLKASAACLLLEHGEMTLYKSHSVSGKNDDDANYPGSTPSGDFSTRAILLSAYASINLERMLKWPGVSAEAELDWIGRWKHSRASGEYSEQKTDTQLSLGVTVAL